MLDFLSKDWLTSNKIYFDTIASVLLSVMAFVVSFQANRLVSSQNKILRIQGRPHISLKTTVIYDPERKIYSERKVVLSFVGDPPINFDAKKVTYLSIQYPDADLTPRSIEIPLNGYYSHTSLIGNSPGILMTIGGHRNNENAANLDKQLREMAESENYPYLLSDILGFAHVSYQDRFGDHIDQYFDISGLDAVTLDPMIGKKKFAEFDEMNALDMEDPQILSKVMNLIKGK